ncbi:MAG TPA: hypothetical protein VL461_01990 [Dictyobacter sp.]|nr:hypothetical protein [Dictyobacter sp.]
MNCSHARALLATYRELNSNPKEASELEEHLAHCQSCQNALAQYQSIGERIRSIPSIESPSDAHQKLMQALAAEHVRFLQRISSSAASTPAPAFLKPYLKDITGSTPQTEHLVTLSTANTGPLPVIQPIKTRRPYKMNHVAILGLAASFLMVVLMGGLTSLLLLANQKGTPPPQPNLSVASVVKPSQVDAIPYTTTTQYPHVASAVANGTTVYYTSYSDDTKSWMLGKFLQQSTNNTSMSTPLLTDPATHPMIVLGADQNWLLWYQIDTPLKQPKNHTNSSTQSTTTNNLQGSWSLHALYIGDTTQQADPTDSLVLYKNTFMTSTAPSWVNTPVQGLWLSQNQVLVSVIDKKGNSYLFNDQLTPNAIADTQQLAEGQKGHVLSSPTATAGGNNIYWSDEWINQNNQLASNIWTQQIENEQPENTGRWAAHMQSETYLLRNNGSSFHPQVVHNTLFYISHPPVTDQVIQNTPTSTPQATGTAQPSQTPNGQTTVTPQIQQTGTPVATPTPTTVNASTFLGGTTRVDPTMQTPQIDETISGDLEAYTANGLTPVTLSINAQNNVSALQGGGRFIIWENTATKSFEMYDVIANAPVIIGANDIPATAAFLATNGNTAVWAKFTPLSTGATNSSDTSTNTAQGQNTNNTTDSKDTTITNTTSTPVSVNFGVLNWPKN